MTDSIYIGWRNIFAFVSCFSAYGAISMMIFETFSYVVFALNNLLDTVHMFGILRILELIAFYDTASSKNLCSTWIYLNLVSGSLLWDSMPNSMQYAVSVNSLVSGYIFFLSFKLFFWHIYVLQYSPIWKGSAWLFILSFLVNKILNKGEF